ncbi:MAG: zinc-dependent alcohol dehydrogenase family protein [Thermoleophilia bacterium]|nr:zinc-dependent alcohol dehydrogenase family protein [Thermoleophilia bacterium]
MRAMILDSPGRPLRLAEVPRPEPGPGQVLLKVHSCGVCRTDLHIVEGELTEPKLPLILGHQIVGTVVELGPKASESTDALPETDAPRVEPGVRVGVPWLGWTDGTCPYCLSGRENLCDQARFTGYDIGGGYAEYAVADARYCFPIPEGYPDLQAAPLLCAGLIGYRALRLAGDGRRLGIYGFGAAAHILVQVARHQGRTTYAFTRPGDDEGQRFALRMGAHWAGGSLDVPPEPLDAAIILAPVGDLVPQALRQVAKGGVVVCGGIHMSDIPSFPYQILWEERMVRSVANLTRKDGHEFLRLAPQIPVGTRVRAFPLEEANEALDELRAGRIEGAAVLVVDEEAASV